MNITNHINELKDRNHIIILIDVEKAFDKIQHAFMIKVLEEDWGNITQIYDKPTANLKAIPLKSRIR